MPLLRHLLRGLIVGLAGLLPGLSGSAFLVLFGLYRPLTAALANPFKNFKLNLLRFGPFFLAAGVGVLIGVHGLATLYARHEVLLLFLFMGFMAGTLPDVWQQARQARGPAISWLSGVFFFALCVGLALWQPHLSQRGAPPPQSAGIWLLAGLGLGLGSLVPGFSTAFLLIHFHLYQPLLAGVSALDWHILGPLIIGAGLAIVLFARIVSWLFDKAEAFTTRGILGLVLGSFWLVYPGLPSGRSRWFALLIFAIGLLLSVALNTRAPARKTHA